MSDVEKRQAIRQVATPEAVQTADDCARQIDAVDATTEGERQQAFHEGDMERLREIEAEAAQQRQQIRANAANTIRDQLRGDESALRRAAAWIQRSGGAVTELERAIGTIAEETFGEHAAEFRVRQARQEVSLQVTRKDGVVKALLVDGQGNVIDEVPFDPNDRASVETTARRLAPQGSGFLQDPRRMVALLQGAMLGLFVFDGFRTMYELEDPLTAVQMLQAYVDVVCRKRSANDDITSDLAAFFNTWNHRLSGPFAVLEGYFAYVIGLSLGFKINALLDRMGDDAKRQLFASLRAAVKTALRQLAERRGKGGEK